LSKKTRTKRVENKGMRRIAKIRKGKGKTETVRVGVGRRKKSPNQPPLKTGGERFTKFQN
jgi:hypothetical protein